MAINDNIPYDGLTKVKSVEELERKSRRESNFFEKSVEHLDAAIKVLQSSTDKSQAEEIVNLKKDIKKAEKRFLKERDELLLAVSQSKKSGATEEELLSLFKEKSAEYTKTTAKFQEEITKIGKDLDLKAKETAAVGIKEQRILQTQLSLAKRNSKFIESDAKKKSRASNDNAYDWDDIQPKTVEDIKEILEKSLKTAGKENAERRREAELQRLIEADHWQEDRDLEKIRDKEDKKLEKKRGLQDKIADTKGSLVAGLLSPFKSITDPLFELFSEDSLNTEEFFQSKFKKKKEDKREIEDEQIKRKRDREDEGIRLERDFESKKNELIVDAQLQFEKLAGGEAALLPYFEKRLNSQEQKVESVPAPPPEETARRESPAPSVENALVPAVAEDLRREIPSPGIESVLAPSPITPFIGEDKESQEQFTADLTNAEYNPLLEKTAPNRNALLAKGGVIGASAVYLGHLLGDQLDDMAEGEDKKKGEGIEGILGKLTKPGGVLASLLPTLASGAGVAAVAAIPLAMLAGGSALQKRDSGDAAKYAKEGKLGRAAETAWLGDRARLTEENANSELGRSTGKTALLAGGVAGVGALTLGGGAAAGMAAGGAAAAGGAGLLGTGLAAAGATAAAVLPPVLIGAAIAAGVTVIAKGTQEALELGWDKNQANIQKELNSVIFDDDASVWEKVKASAESTWKGFTGSLAGGIREAGSVLDAETMIQNEKQIKFLQERADAGNEDYARLLDLMQSEQFKAMDENEQKMLMQSEGLYDDYKKMQQETQKSFGEHLLTAGRTVGGFFTGLVDTAMEGARGKATARWNAEVLRGMENMSGEDVSRLQQSKEYQEAMANGGDVNSAMKAAYLKEQKDLAIARGDLTKDGMAIQTSGSMMGGVLGNKIGKYFGLGDMGLAYKERKTGTDELDNEYRQTFEYSKRKAELMNEGKTAEEADLAVIAEQNQLYQDALELRLKRTKEYQETFDKVLEETGDIQKAEDLGLDMAKRNRKNSMATNKLMKAKFTEVWGTFKNFAKNIGGWFKDKFSDVGQGAADLGRAVADGASAVWGAVIEGAGGVGEGVNNRFTQVLDGVTGSDGKPPLGDPGTGARLPGEEPRPDASINDGIVLKNGKVVEISPDDNVYATKKEPRVVRDQEAQAAMPSVQKPPVEFTDKNIVATLQAILNRLNKMDVRPQVVTSGGDVNFDGLKMAGNL